MRNRPTSKDVARLAGVSQTVVSFVLNDHPHVAPQTRERVREAARMLGYRPDLSARSLVRGRTQTVGVLMVDLQNPFFAALAHHLERAVRAAGYHFVLNTSTWDAWGKYDQISVLLEELLLRRVEAVLAWGGWGYQEARRETDPVHTLLSAGHRTPLFVMGSDEHADGIVTLDHAAGGALAARHFLECGRRRLGVVTNNPDDRWRGFRQTLLDAGVEEPRLWRADEFTHENRVSGYQIGQRIAALPAAERPDGLFCHNDLVAAGVLCGLSDGGVRVPEDIALIGFDALEESLYLRPSLTSVAFPIADMCQLIVARMVAVLHGTVSPASERQAMLPPLGLRLGQSTLGADAPPTACSRPGCP